MPIKKGKIGNALESVAPDHTVTTADQIFDENLGKYQNEINQEGGGGYTPPVGGIPKTDLSSDVQASLDKADAAVPSARTVNGKALSSNITLNASDVGALPSSTTIPTSLSQLGDDSTHRTVTDSEKTNWNDKYTKTEVNNMLVSAPEANVVVIENPSGADPTTLLPSTPAANTIYRVMSADGTYFSEYEHNGTKYVLLADRRYGIDNTPTAGSTNFPNSSGTWEFARDMVAAASKPYVIDEVPTGGWTKFNEVLEGWFLVDYEGSSGIDIRFYKIPFYSPTSADVRTVTFRNGRKKGIVYLTKEYTRYVIDDAIGRVKIILTPLRFSILGIPFLYDDFSVGTIHNGYITSSTIETQNYGNWRYSTANTIKGHMYIVVSNCSNGNPVVGLSDDGLSIKCIYSELDSSVTNQESISVTCFIAKTNVVGFNSYKGGSNMDYEGYYRIIDVTTFPSAKDDTNRFTTELGKLYGVNDGFFSDINNMTNVTEYSNGFFADDGTLETQNYGNWRYKIIDVTSGQWYLLRCPIFTNIRVVDIDGSGNIFINNTIPQSYYNSRSTDDDTYVVVKAKYNKLGFSFKENKSEPKYCRVSDISILRLFMQMYENIENTGSRTFIVDKSGGGDYTSFAEAVLDNYGKRGITLQLRPGNYDLLSELAAYYGTDDFLPLTKYGRGLELGYGITIEGCPNAVIMADYLGSNADIMTYYSPLNTTKEVNGGGFTLRGVNIRCSRVRYCVHDEKTSSGTGAYTNIYESCNFYIDNRNNTAWNSAQCIGGGLGTSGTIIVRNSIFESLSNNFDGEVVSWHNNANAGAKSIISCTDNYIKGNGGFRFSWYGQSIETTEVICAGNNVGKAAVIRAENPSSTNQNVVLYDWNNIVRN